MKIHYLIFLTALLACEQSIKPNKALFPARQHGRVGFININGTFEIQPAFDEAKRFSEGLAAIRIDSLWGYIDSTGSITIKPKFYNAEQFSSSRALVELKSIGADQAFIDKSGSIVFKPEEYTWNFSEGFARTRVEGKIAYYNINGEIEILTDCPYGDSFREGIAKIWTGDSSRYIDKTGKTIIKLSGMGHGQFSEGLAGVRISGRNTYINKKGEVVIDNLSMVGVLFDFSDGMAKVTVPGVDHRSGFINRKGEVVIPVEHHIINDFHNGFAAFLQNNKWGFYNTKGEVILPPFYDWVDYDHGFEGGLCWVSKDSKRGYINKTGQFVWTQDDSFMYRSVDTSVWKLDTLEVSNSLFADRNVYNNIPESLTSDSTRNVQLFVNPNEITPYANKYFGNKIYLINGTSDTLQMDAQDGRIKLLQQALNEDGTWEYLENFIDSWCGNSYFDVKLPAKHYYVFSSPIFKGDISTMLRYELTINRDKKIYSNEYSGQISKTQFLTGELREFSKQHTVE